MEGQLLCQLTKMEDGDKSKAGKKELKKKKNANSNKGLYQAQLQSYVTYESCGELNESLRGREPKYISRVHCATLWLVHQVISNKVSIYIQTNTLKYLWLH
jgi:hypothetical protein